MKLDYLLFSSLVFLLSLFSCESDTSEKNKFTLGEPLLPKSTFSYIGNQDTVLIGKEGVQIHIPANSFLNKSGKPYDDTVKITLTEAISLENMILGNLNTISSDSFVLESSGMFKIEIEKLKSNVFLNHESQIKITLPNNIKHNSSLYYGLLDDNNQIFWKQSHLVDDDSSNYWLLKGRNILYKECSSCHNTDLISDMTGPALAWVSKRWKKTEDLISFTRNSELFARSGNLRARYMIDWSASAMTSFDLSDQEIKAIYDYIDSECLVRNIDLTQYGFSQSTKNYQNYIRTQDSLKAVRTFNSVLVLEGNSILINGGWYNIDRLLRIEGVEEVKIEIIVNNEVFKGQSTVKLVFPKRNITINASYNQANDTYTFIKNSPLIKLPINEEAYLVAISKLEEEPSFIKKKITINKSQKEALDLNKSTAQSIIKELKNIM